MNSKIAQIKYNGEIGFKAKIRDVISFMGILIGVDEFLDFTNENGVKNRDIVLNSYDFYTKKKLNLVDDNNEDKENASSYITGDMPCPNPITFFISVENVTKDLLVNQSNLLFADDSTQTFYDKDTGEFTVSVNRFYENVISQTKQKIFFDYNEDSIRLQNQNKNVVFRENLKPQIWIWCKSLCPNGDFNENSIFNLTDFVQEVSTNQTETGGNFSIELVPIEGMLKIENNGLSGIWQPKNGTYVKYNYNEKTNFIFRNIFDRFSKVTNLKEISVKDEQFNPRLNDVQYKGVSYDESENYSFIRSDDFFKNLISENDVIFITFEEDENPFTVEDDFFINHRYLKGKDWDLIGLVDNNSESNNFESSDRGISISGRDLMKLLIEDGSYFFAKSYSHPDSSEGIFFNVKTPNSGDEANTLNNRINGNSKGINRLITTGMIDMLFNPQARNIQFIMNLMISRLSNIEICHSDLFKYYGDEVTKFFVPITETLEEQDTSINTTDGD